MPPLKAFMDDATIICSKEDETRRMLERLDVLMAWCRIKFKPKKSRSLPVRKSKIDETTIFTVASQQIPTVSQEIVKSLGRWYDSFLKDIKRRLETVELATEGLLAINRCGLQGKLKVYCLQFMLIPKLLCPLLVYEICSTTVQATEAQINKFTRRWLGVPPGLPDVAIYCRKAKLRLPLKSEYGTVEKETGPHLSAMPRQAATEHVLSSCKIALSQGRYTCRQNRVFQDLAAIICTAK
ncbi:hypothetical protein RRG08_010413 [Elysia crispata]|uniref:Reverse transcriptase domain-containing protein n=1 Tax=Elysia crispata TaxID=231223 RepID=A0AAE1D3H2_9GAST|nr:hypothetical protein RRG08_010413 [Elysia crispata]